MTITTLTDAVQLLQKQVAGTILTPNDPAYEQARRGWNLTIEQHPALILVAAHAQDVVAGVRFANEQGLAIGIKSTGHGIHYPADDSLLIVTSQLNAVAINPETATARVEAGAVWQQVLDAATPHGLAPLLGTAPHVGVVGYTLGGGFGWLARRYGLAADHVHSIEIVTADGTLWRTSRDEQSDLFWGLCGGGGNFGVVTAIEFKLFPVSTIYGGSITYPGELATEALRFFREWSASVPEELGSSIGLVKFPPLPSIPEALRGKLQVIVRAAFTGNSSEGQALIQPWLDWNAPGSNTFKEMPFADIGTIQNDPVAPAPGAGSSEMFDTLSDQAIDVIVQTMTSPASALLFSEIRHAGGAIARANAGTNAIGNRMANYYLVIGALVMAPEARARVLESIEQFKTSLRPYVQNGIYLNFVSGFSAAGEVRERTKDAFEQSTFERLVALKAKYDPKNLFCFSYQLVPQRKRTPKI